MKNLASRTGRYDSFSEMASFFTGMIEIDGQLSIPTNIPQGDDKFFYLACHFPEGIIVSGPLKEDGMPKWKAFLLGFVSGVVEPIASLLAIALTVFVSTILPYTLAFAAGVMIYVVVEELIPEANEGEHSNLATIGLAIGFVLMMVLDIALG